MRHRNKDHPVLMHERAEWSARTLGKATVAPLSLCLENIITDVSGRFETGNLFDDSSSGQSRAREWIQNDLKDATPIDLCDETEKFHIEQRFALAMFSFSLGGDGWAPVAIGSRDGKWLTDELL